MDCSMPGFPVPHYLLVFAQVLRIESVMLPTISSDLAAIQQKAKDRENFLIKHTSLL